MNFEIHRSCRWGDDHDTRAYFTAKLKYFNHLTRIPFSPRSTLLRYFGDSFFHDGTLSSIVLDRVSKTIEMTIWTFNDLEDINTYRSTIHMKPYSRFLYQRNPIRYLCTFTGVTRYRAHSAHSRTIMDSEIAYSAKTRCYSLAISFSPKDELTLTFNSCRVIVDSTDRVPSLAGGRSSIPRCAVCRDKLLNQRKIAGSIEKWSNQAL